VSEHKFKIGQLVVCTFGPYGSGRSASVYKIMRLLPPQGGDYQYRVRCADEPFDRVANESDLDRAK
jgi:hypothetical protein